jgi:hypothetical protein
LNFARKRRVWHEFIVELHAEHVRLRLERFEVDPEFCVSLRLDIVGDVLAVDRHDDLEVAGAGLGGVDREVHWNTKIKIEWKTLRTQW